ncbi:MAG: hypothetical protein HC802_00450 [Caldilineaceae bacterium]|nr:hypothetical protein [Caldilineaceae bacterium]
MEHRIGDGHPEESRHLHRHRILLASGHLAEAQGNLPAAQQAFVEIWQQNQGQSYFWSATLIGLGCVAIKGGDWPAARQYFATALPLTAQLETASQSLEALAGMVHLQAQAGQLEEALTWVGLVRHHPSSYQESKDRLDVLETELRAKLTAEKVKAALALGQTTDLWDTVLAAGHWPQRTDWSWGIVSISTAI